MNYKNKTTDFKKLHPDTQMVRGGTIRSNFGETSEAIFLNSGYCYNDAETAESRFNGEDPSFVYSRYLNPSLKMLEDKMASLPVVESVASAAAEIHKIAIHVIAIKKKIEKPTLIYLVKLKSIE